MLQKLFGMGSAENRSATMTSIRFAIVLAASMSGGCRKFEAIDAVPTLEQLPPTDRARVDLGQRLFFDAGLSADGTIACATCHVPSEAGVDGRPVSVGIGGQEGARNAPTVLNVGFKQHLFWDGRADSLEEQSLVPLRASNEMAAVDEVVVAYVAADPTYAEAFAHAFGTPTVSMGRIAIAISAYERQLATPSRVDAFLSGDDGALAADEQRGLEFFQANCAFCHDGPGVGGQRFEKLGAEIAWPKKRTHDLGRYEVTGNESDKLVFAVPQLRNVARTAPYFHDGSVETLEEAVKLMGHHQLGLDLDEARVSDIVSFLEALSADPDPRLLEAP